MGAVLADPGSGDAWYLSEVVPERVARRFGDRENAVVVAELGAVAVAIEAFRNIVRGRDLTILVDAEAVEAALVKGGSSAADLDRVANGIWMRLVDLEVAAYFDRVPTDSNVSDGPSRGHCDELDTRRAKRTDARRSMEGLGVMNR